MVKNAAVDNNWVIGFLKHVNSTGVDLEDLQHYLSQQVCSKVHDTSVLLVLCFPIPFLPLLVASMKVCGFLQCEIGLLSTLGASMAVHAANITHFNRRGTGQLHAHVLENIWM